MIWTYTGSFGEIKGEDVAALVRLGRQLEQRPDLYRPFITVSRAITDEEALAALDALSGVEGWRDGSPG